MRLPEGQLVVALMERGKSVPRLMPVCLKLLKYVSITL
jgi:hypothetical protein